MCPAPQIPLFSTPDEVHRILVERFRVTSFRPGQEEVIRALLDGNEVLAVMPTGAGKSLCYQLPALLIEGVTLVVSPLISLMQDQLAELSALGIPAARIDSTQSAEEQRRVFSSLESGGHDRPRLLFVAPERFRSTRFVEAVARAGVGLLAVDEAHCISEWGHDFRPDYARLGEAIARLRPRRLVALTATATERVREDIARALGMARPSVFVRGFDRINLDLAVERVAGDADKRAVLERLLDEAKGPALIYTATRKKAEAVAGALALRGRSVRCYHAGLDDDERAQVQRSFMAGDLSVVVATNAFGMGVDKADVRLVVHHELPRSIEAYYQEAGRAGRDGAPARCVLLFHHGDVRLQEFLIDAACPERPVLEALRSAVASGGGEAWAIERRAGVSSQNAAAGLRLLARQGVIVEAGTGFQIAEDAPPIDRLSVERQRDVERERLRRVTAYAYSATCRRHLILEYFGDPARQERCERCDACRARSNVAALDDAQHLLVRKVLSCVARVDGSFGRKRIALVLEGSRVREVTDAGLERISTHGALAGRSHGFVMELLGALEAAGLITPRGRDYPTLAITPAGREVMHDRVRAQIAWPSDLPVPVGRARKSSPPPSGPWDPELVTRLRDLRKRLAHEAALPAFCVCHDRTLFELARARPTDESALLAVPGIGPAKVERWGAPLLDLFRSL